MRERKETYESLGRKLNLSPATVKRRLNGEDISLSQLKQMARVFSISFYELIELSKRVRRTAHLFTKAQEDLLASDPNFMTVFRRILTGQTFAEIKSAIGMSDRELRRVARRLEDVELARLLPGDWFEPLVRFPFQWQKNGALERQYQGHLLRNLFYRIENGRDQAGFYKQFEFALSSESYLEFCKAIEVVYEKYRALSEIHLDTKPDWNHLVSGLLFIDRFSLWDR
jgi:transcriptional regulator with XRE-family HTH domain